MFPQLNNTMEKIQIIKEKKKNIYSSIFSEDYSAKFFYKSILHQVVCMEIYENNSSDGISFETICYNVPKLIGSRSSIQIILNEALEKGIFVKQQSIKDKRIKKYFLTSSFLNMINAWLNKEYLFFIESAK